MADVAILRIIDANLNRAREGLRVLEEHARLVLEDAALTTRIKALRHELADAAKSFGASELLAARDIENDVGTRITTDDEMCRSNGEAVASAAAKRASEAIRCVEEYGKTLNAAAAGRFETLRYKLYAAEQDCLVAAPRRRRLRQARIHVLVTESLCRGPWMSVCESAIAGGADVIQLREKSLGDAEILRRAERLGELTRRRNVLLIINDRADLARLAGADGVHLGHSDLSVAQARQIGGPTLLVGKSAHSAEEFAAALAERPDYVAIGPMFPSHTKPEVPVQGPRLLSEATGRAGDTPIIAIGGITPANVMQLGVGPKVQIAVCQSVIAADHAEAAVKALRGALA